MKLYPGTDAARLRAVIADLFPEGVERVPDEEKCIRILRFSCTHIALGPAESLTPTHQLIDSQLASCGGFAMVFCDLARCAGLPARYLGFFGIPDAASHAVAEAFYADRWHLFDPTFGVLFRGTDRADVLGALDVFSGVRPAMMIKVADRPWQRDYDRQRSFGEAPATGMPGYHVESYWASAKRAVTFPIAYGNSACVSFPVFLDFRTCNEIAIGTVDGSSSDIYHAYASQPNVGYMYIGGDCPHSLYHVSIWSARPSAIRLSLHVTDESRGKLNFFPLAHLHLLRTEHERSLSTFVLHATQEYASALVWSDGLHWIDALHALCAAPGQTLQACPALPNIGAAAG